MERVLTLKANYFVEKCNHDVSIIMTDGKDREPYYRLSPKIRLVYLDLNFDRMFALPMYKRILYYITKQRQYKKKLKKTLFELRPDITISLLRREINFINNIKDGSRKIGEIHFDKDNYRSLRNENGRSPLKAVLAKMWMGKLIHELKRLEKFVVLSYEDQAKWTELDNSIVINNPLPFMTETISNCTNKQVIVVGRYTHQKGIDLIIKAWKQVEEKHRDWHLRIFGAGDRETYQSLVNKTKLEQSIHLETAIPNIEEKYLESSIFVLSSRYEGYPMALIEAMSCGLPVVSFTCPCGPKDIVKDGEDGFLVDLGNTDLLAERICYLIEHESLRKEMGRNARKNINRLHINQIAEQWNALFEASKSEME
jgi:glycosyltransferase involved in cell wall biosynthesis